MSKREKPRKRSVFKAFWWRRERDSNPCGRVPKRFSRPPRYDHFDIPPYMNCRQADFIRYSIFLEMFLEMRFYDVWEMPEKSMFTRLFDLFATAMLANFQDRLVMTASICLRTRLLYHKPPRLSSPPRKRTVSKKAKKASPLVTRLRSHARTVSRPTVLL